jgi:hypothetical protein
MDIIYKIIVSLQFEYLDTRKLTVVSPYYNHLNLQHRHILLKKHHAPNL